MNTVGDWIWVRELNGDESPTLDARTGDVLPDGSVLLWREDMDRMGLESLRHWLAERVIVAHATVAIAARSGRMSASRAATA